MHELSPPNPSNLMHTIYIFVYLKITKRYNFSVFLFIQNQTQWKFWQDFSRGFFLPCLILIQSSTDFHLDIYKSKNPSIHVCYN